MNENVLRPSPKRPNYIWLASLVCISVAGCTPSSVSPVTDLPASAKTIALVPALPEQLIFATRGVTVFGNNLDTPSIDDWHLDDAAYQSAANVLAPKYQVVEIKPDVDIIDQQSRLDASLKWGMVDDVGQLVQQHVHPAQPVDLYVVLCVSARSHPYSDMRPAYFMQDVGVSHMNSPFDMDANIATVMHSFLLLTIVDGKTFKVLYDTPLLLPPGSNVSSGPLFSTDNPYPAKVLHDFAWHEKWADLSDDQRQQVQQGITSLLTQSVSYTLQKSILMAADR